VPNASLTVEAAATAARNPARVPPRGHVRGDQDAEHAERDDPPAQSLERAHELAVHGEHYRRRLGDEHGRESRKARPTLDGVPDVGPVSDREPGRNERDAEGEGERRDRLESRSPSSGQETDDDQDDRPETECVVEEAPDRIEPVRDGGEEPHERSL
jgi:hypothetical protein